MPRLARTLVLLLWLSQAGCHCSPHAPGPGPCSLLPSREGNFTVATYNVNFQRPRPQATLAVIRELQVDVLCLQETTPDWQRQLETELSATYPHRAFLPSPDTGGGGGLAILSRFAFEPPVTHQPPAGGWWPAWQTTVHTPAGDVQVLLLHLRPALEKPRRFTLGAYFGTPEVRRREMEYYLAKLAPDVPTLVLGDFNEPSWGQASGLLAEAGYFHALGACDRITPTWHWPGELWLVTGRLDHICHSLHLWCPEAYVLRAGGSDHYPVVAELHIAKPAPAHAGR